MTFLFALDFIKFGLTDVLDILIVAFILYELYSLLKGTAAVRIFWGIALLYVAYKFAGIFHLTLVTEIIGQVISVGVIALIVVFQPEIRDFLLLLGNRKIFKKINKRLTKVDHPELYKEDFDAISLACERMSASKTGALIILSNEAPLDDFIATGERIDARISHELLENIFYKNSPLHDGAVIIRNHRITAAKAILPVSKRDDLPGDLGLRHRAAIGATTSTDAIAIIVSEQTGYISFCKEGNISRNISANSLKQRLIGEFVNE